MIAYVSTDNSDDQLTQRMWACFQLDLKQAIHDGGGLFHGEWHSLPDSIFQNACICVEIDDDNVPELKGVLAAIAQQYFQTSIAWATAPVTEFLGQKDAA